MLAPAANSYQCAAPVPRRWTTTAKQGQVKPFTANILREEVKRLDNPVNQVQDNLVIGEGNLAADFRRDCSCNAGDDNPY